MKIRVIDRLYAHRVEVFLFSQLVLLFDSLIFSQHSSGIYAFSLLYSFNIATGLLITLSYRICFRIISALLICSVIIAALDFPLFPEVDRLVPQIVIYFAFHAIVAVVLIEQTLKTKVENYQVVLGVLSGYISIGMVSFFLFILLEHLHPGSFMGLPVELTENNKQEEALMYAAFITLMTVGYGDIVPLTPIARKAAIIVGLAGQFYMAVLTAIIVGKFIQVRASRKKD